MGFQKMDGQGMTILGGKFLVRDYPFFVSLFSVSKRRLGLCTSPKNQMFVYIFADLVLKDKVVVYDLANQRIGWVNYDCKSILISTTFFHY